MKKIKNCIKRVLVDVAYSSHGKDVNDDYKRDIRRIENIYKSAKEKLKNMEEDISLYRYKLVNAYAKKEIEEQRIFMNVPSKFDDLFDSNFVVDIEEPDSNFAPHFHALYFSKYIEENIQRMSCERGTNGWDEYYEQVNEDVDRLIRVSSLSEDYKNIPLWYYYANQYKGICIEYSLKEIATRLRENEYIMPVIYTDNYFKYNPAATYNLEQTKMSVQANALIKHDSWEFEKEWRIVQIRNENSGQYTDIIPIKSITFGLKTDEYDKREIMNLNAGVEFYELKRTCYGLKRVKI